MFVQLDKTPDQIQMNLIRELAPGISWKRYGLSGPGHAIPALASALKTLGLKPVKATGASRPPDPYSWEDVEEALKGQVRPEFLGNWPAHYQKEALQWAAPRMGAMFHHPTGSGKTFTAICWALLYPGPVLIITRAASRLQYARQVDRFTNLRAFLIKPSAEVRKKDKWKSLTEYLDWCRNTPQRPVVVVGWEALSSWHNELIRVPWASVVWDESHKGKAKKRWEAVPIPAKGDPLRAEVLASLEARGGKLKEQDDGTEIGFVPADNTVYTASTLAQRAQRRLATTATPIPDRVRDLWGQLDLIEPFQWGRYRDFAMRYCDAREGIYGGLDDRGQSNVAELVERLRWVVHRVPGVLTRQSLPPKRRETWYIPRSEQVAPSGGWQKIIKAAQAEGPQSMLGVKLAMAASAKRPAIVARTGEHMQSNHKVVIFTAYRRDCKDLYESLGKLKGKSKPAAIWIGHGEHSQEERAEILQAYIDHPGPCVLVGTGPAWGTAIDGLQCTDAAIFALLPFTPGDLDQWEGRFTRLGQDRPVVIYYPIAEGTADERLADILLNKLPAVDALAPSDSLDGAADALAGFVNDPNLLAKEVLGMVDSVSTTLQDDEDDEGYF